MQIKTSALEWLRLSNINENGDVVKCESAKDGSYEKLYYNDSLQLTNYYNKKGELTSVTDSLSSANVTCVYNSLGQMTSYTEKQGNSTKIKQAFTYDEYGNTNQMTLSGGVRQTYKYSYDDLSDRRFNGMSFGGATSEVTYDNLDRIKTKKVTYNGTEVYTKTYDYRDVKHSSTQTNATNQPKSIVYTKGTSTKQNIQYTYYDMTGKLSGMNVNGKSIEYTYKDNKLSQEKNYLLGTKSTKNYSFRGNISSDKKEILLSGGGSVEDKTINYSYTGDFMKYYGSLPCMYDAMGNPTMYCGKNAKWKGKQLTEFDGNYFNYDGRGRRMRKNAINYVYDSDGRLIRQYKDESKITEPQTFIFYYDFEGVAAFKYTDKNNNGTMFFYLRDGQGNIIAIVDSTGSVVVQYYYDAWGNHKVVNANGDEITDQDDIGNVNPFRYRGYYYDTETGLYFLQTRYYDPEVGRFLNRDSVQYADPETINGLNLYAYCLNNPIAYKDSNGYIPISVWSAAFGFATDLSSGFGRLMISASIKAFESLAGVSMYILDDLGGAVFNPAYYKGITQANKLLYGGKILSTLGKIGKYAGYGFLALDIGLSLYNNITNPNLSLSRKVTDSIVDIGFAVGGNFLSIGVSALLMGLISGPWGVVIGAGAAIAVNLSIWAFQTFGTIYNDIKVNFNNFITQTVPMIWNDLVTTWNNFWSFAWI